MFYFSGFTNGQQTILTLEDCVLLAIEKNISIKQSELEYESAEIDKSDAIGNFSHQLIFKQIIPGMLDKSKQLLGLENLTTRIPLWEQIGVSITGV